MAATVGVPGGEVAEAESPGRIHDRKRTRLVEAFAEERWFGSDAAEAAAAERDPRHVDGGATKCAQFDLKHLVSDELDGWRYPFSVCAPTMPAQDRPHSLGRRIQRSADGSRGRI